MLCFGDVVNFSTFTVNILKLDFVVSLLCSRHQSNHWYGSYLHRLSEHQSHVLNILLMKQSLVISHLICC